MTVLGTGCVRGRWRTVRTSPLWYAPANLHAPTGPAWAKVSPCVDRSDILSCPATRPIFPGPRAPAHKIDHVHKTTDYFLAMHGHLSAPSTFQRVVAFRRPFAPTSVRTLVKQLVDILFGPMLTRVLHPLPGFGCGSPTFCQKLTVHAALRETSEVQTRLSRLT